MYWNNIGNEISLIYNNFFDDSFDLKLRQNTLVSNINNLLFKIKKNDTNNINSHNKLIKEKDKITNFLLTLKRMKKDLIREFNKNNLENYSFLPFCDSLFKINKVSDYSIKYLILLNNNYDDSHKNIENLMIFSNILGMNGFKLFNFNPINNVFEFQKNIKKFNVKFYLTIIDSQQNNIYNLHNLFNNIDKQTLLLFSFIKENINNNCDQIEFKFDLLIYNFLLAKSNTKNFFSQTNIIF